jgi:GTPase SAR1 family protein/predicted MPP superfamily phosphohydrolase
VSGKETLRLEGHSQSVRSVAWNRDGSRLASGSSDKTVRVWDAVSGKETLRLEGHRDWVWSVAWNRDGSRLASGSDDQTVRVWDAVSGKETLRLEGHSQSVRSVAWNRDGSRLASLSGDSVWVWDVATGKGQQVLGPLRAWQHPLLVDFFTGAAPPQEFGREDVWVDTYGATAFKASTGSYTSAKVMLIGESNVGKSCLAMRLAEDRYEEQETTHGMRFWKLAPEQLGDGDTPEGAQREIVLWDMGGQGEYRLVHQIFYRHTTLALFLFDPTRGDAAFDDVRSWNTGLASQIKDAPITKLLVRAKLDATRDNVVDRQAIKELMKECGFAGYHEISAKEREGFDGDDGLCAAVSARLEWDNLTRTSRPAFFQHVRERVEAYRKRGDAVLLYDDLRRELAAENHLDYDEARVNTVVRQLCEQGYIAETRLATSERALVLQIGDAERYAGSLILAARDNPRGTPALEQAVVATARMVFPNFKEGERLAPQNERIVLECVAQLLIEHGLCLEHQGLLIFPSLFKYEPPHDEREALRGVSLYYDFTGAIDNIYAALVTRLALGQTFGPPRFWRNRAQFEREGQGVCGLRKQDTGGGVAHLDLYFNEHAPDEQRNLFTVYVEEFLRQEGVSITEVLAMTCGGCANSFAEADIRKRLARGRAEISCPVCDAPNRIQETAARQRELNSTLNMKLLGLKTRIERGTAQSVTTVKMVMEESFRDSQAEEKSVVKEPLRILHLSDLHFGADTDADIHWQKLEADLSDPRDGFGLERLDYLVISGDITNRAAPEEFAKASEMLTKLIKRFKLSAQKCVIVPGNHDQSWAVTKDIYTWHEKDEIPGLKLKPKTFKVEQGNMILLRNDKYPQRFDNFARFYHTLTTEPYPLEPEQQGLSFLFHDTGLQFIALNSEWQIDKYSRDTAGINQSALARALLRAEEQTEEARRKNRLAPDARVLKIAVWHHPVTGNEKITDDAFLEQLQKADVKLCLHGHVHENRADLVGYLDSTRRLHIAGAGSFGASAKDRPESTPCLYNLIEIERDLSRVRVHTRKRDKSGGAWTANAVWPSPHADQKSGFYDIQLTS